ncbi:GntR family transcriptional regulator [Paraburkholderia sp. ZP32-5]|uniref:GntR family transcriptional regulator n=1 Tax=Paraburkholderia sp. ZP32-5 TaxID=2883245 RepID=UPI001F47CE06|nr:GntR family transcriptional regulator [Paraburkholderia sp. ZP32-5]
MTDDTANLTKQPRRTALRQTTLTETIYTEMRRRLRHGEIGPNDRVLDYEVADEFDCTRMPVRQVLLRLVSEGYLVGTTRGFVVPTLTSGDVREIFEVRRLLEPSAAASTAAILDERVDDVLKRAFQKARKAYEKNDGDLMIEANIAFRDAWLDAVQNSRLRVTIRRFADHAQQVRLRTLKDHATQKIVVDGMQAMLNGFLERDPKRIKSATQDFIASAEQRYFALLEGEE